MYHEGYRVLTPGGTSGKPSRARRCGVARTSPSRESTTAVAAEFTKCRDMATTTVAGRRQRPDVSDPSTSHALRQEACAADPARAGRGCGMPCQAGGRAAGRPRQEGGREWQRHRGEEGGGERRAGSGGRRPRAEARAGEEGEDWGAARIRLPPPPGSVSRWELSVMPILVSILLFYTVIEHSVMVSARGCPDSTCISPVWLGRCNLSLSLPLITSASVAQWGCLACSLSHGNVYARSVCSGRPRWAGPAWASITAYAFAWPILQCNMCDHVINDREIFVPNRGLPVLWYVLKV